MCRARVVRRVCQIDHVPSVRVIVQSMQSLYAFIDLRKAASAVIHSMALLCPHGEKAHSVEAGTGAFSFGTVVSEPQFHLFGAGRPQTDAARPTVVEYFARSVEFRLVLLGPNTPPPRTAVVGGRSLKCF